ncbi:helix-turn-helix transcriptional regulator [Streptomyces sp. RK75]|uniref:helix-turn-helix domain-containing protein n=1 Tax=Streptomyces sp. RK75 TaxID=2824895 RepID=UPI001B37F373|nr:helix-turn-helix transcriptional regulator [Streptomyces sp. RK75]MBQ0866784.1 helix-turn-helix transcriptional regulator [Streptomyces sp. RK75]
MAEHDDEWEAGLEDDSSAVLRAVSRQIKLWREAAGMTQGELGAAIGYGEEIVSAVERGKRLPKPEFLDGADQALGADGKLSAMKEDVKQARYPKKVRDLAKLEAKAVEIGAYGGHNIEGLLQTEEYARALFAQRRPAYGEEELDRQVAARMARQAVLEHRPSLAFTFVQEEVTLRRPIGGKAVLRQQLAHLLEVAQLRHVTIQVMPTASEEHAGMAGGHRIYKFPDGKTLGHSEGQMTSRLISDPKEAQILEMRYGMLRSQALTPRESLALIEKVLGET